MNKLTPEFCEMSSNFIDSSESQERDWRWTLAVKRALNIPVAFLLMLAAGLKSHQLSIAAPFENTTLPIKAAVVALVIFEILFAIGLISGRCVKVFRNCGITLFCLFAVYSGWIALMGSRSCGCLGVLTIHPAVMLVVDILMVVALLFWDATGFRYRLQSRVLLIIATSATGVVIWTALPRQTIDLAAIKLGENSTKLIVLKPEDWVGKLNPLGNYLDIEKSEFETGKWNLVLYHEDCPSCQRAIGEIISNGGEVGTVFVEFPPFGKNDNRDTGNFKWRKVRDDFDWFVVTPVAIGLADGRVIEVKKLAENKLVSGF